MTKNSLNKILTDNKFICPSILIKSINNLNLSLNEFILLIYFYNNPNTNFNIENISEVTGLKESVVMETFGSLTEKSLIKIVNIKDDSGLINDCISIEPIYELINNYISVNEVKDAKDNIYSIFEKEFGRTISPLEYEMINGWISIGNSEELIVEALKEAVYNGVNNFRYIDKIIYEWSKKGYKTKEDIEKSRKDRSVSKSDLFDYNWLDEE